MTTTSFIGMGVIVFLATAALDYAHTNYVMSVHAKERHRAARWSVLQWAAATVGFLAAIKVSLYLLPFEAAGLYVGTLLAVPRRTPPTSTASCSGSEGRTLNLPELPTTGSAQSR